MGLRARKGIECYVWQSEANRPFWWSLPDQGVGRNVEHKHQVMRHIRGEHELYRELGYTQFILYFRKVSAIFCLNSKTNL